MQSHKKKQPSSKLKSFYLSCRSHIPCSNSLSSTKLAISPIVIPKKLVLASHKHKHIHNHKRSSASSVSVVRGDHHNGSIEMNWQRVNELERELVDLEEWLGTELARLKRYLKSNNKINCDDQLCFTKVYGDQRDVKFWRLDNGGGYFYSLNGKLLNEGCQDLIIQFSSPSLVPPEIGSNISKVLCRMAATGKENLTAWLLKSMAMTDVSMIKTHKIAIHPCNTPKGLLEAILLKALKKLGHLVMEGLRIQMGVKEVVKKKQSIARRRSTYVEEKVDDHAKDDALVIMAMLIQPRDPQKGYEAMNEMMIGFVEIGNNGEEEDDDEEEDSRFYIRGVHVAGLEARKRNGEAIHNCLWYVSA